MREMDIDRIAEMHRRIDTVLLREWDPIGVAGVTEARNEYRGYTRAVYDVAVESRSAQAVAEHLVNIERDSMGLSARDPRLLLPVAQMIVDAVSEL